MREADLYNLLVKGALRDGWPLYRIADGSPGKKPFDIGGCTPTGIAVGLEVKVTDARWDPHTSPCPWKSFEVHQTAWLQHYCKANAFALVGLYASSCALMLVARVKIALWNRPFIEWEPVALHKVQDAYRGWQQLL